VRPTGHAGHRADRRRRSVMSEIDARLREEVHLLGELLGETIREQWGEAFLEKIELIRTGAKGGRRGSRAAADQLGDTLDGLRDGVLMPVARAFTPLLNLDVMAEQHHQVRGLAPCEAEPFEMRVLDQLLPRLLAGGADPAELAARLACPEIELVLSA